MRHENPQHSGLALKSWQIEAKTHLLAAELIAQPAQRVRMRTALRATVETLADLRNEQAAGEVLARSQAPARGRPSEASREPARCVRGPALRRASFRRSAHRRAGASALMKYPRSHRSMSLLQRRPYLAWLGAGACVLAWSLSVAARVPAANPTRPPRRHHAGLRSGRGLPARSTSTRSPSPPTAKLCSPRAATAFSASGSAATGCQALADAIDGFDDVGQAFQKEIPCPRPSRQPTAPPFPCGAHVPVRSALPEAVCAVVACRCTRVRRSSEHRHCENSSGRSPKPRFTLAALEGVYAYIFRWG